MRRFIIVAVFILAYLSFAGPAYAINQAGLVIQHGDGRIVTRIISFKETAISGTELLEHSGLTTSIVSSPTGEAVYMIDGEGNPEGWVVEAGKTYYWNYFRLRDGIWRYSNVGAGLTKVKDGDVEGWLWQAAGQGTVLPKIKPSEIGVSGRATVTATKGEPASGGAGRQNLSYLLFGIIAGVLSAGIITAVIRNRRR